MSATLRYMTKLIAYADGGSTQNPMQKLADWSRDISDVGIENPRNELVTLAPGEQRTFFDGAQILTVDGTTTFSFGLVPGEVDRYRLTHTGGTAPGFRTARALNATGGTVAVAVNANGLATMTITGGPTWASVLEGDTIYVPTAAEIGVQPLSGPNTGRWLVVGQTSGVISLTRFTDDFEAMTETVAITAANQIQAFSANGVQDGDQIQFLAAGFGSSFTGSYPVVAVTASYIDIQSSLPLPARTSVQPTAAGISIYTSAKRMVYIETEQEIVVRLNGDTSDRISVSPWIGGKSSSPGTFQKTGATWSLSIVNKSLRPASVVVFSVE